MPIGITAKTVPLRVGAPVSDPARLENQRLRAGSETSAPVLQRFPAGRRRSGRWRFPAGELFSTVRYLVKAKVKPGCEKALLQAVADGSLGRGSIAGDEYDWDMKQARVGDDGVAHWVEACFCATPLAEERPYWEEYFELLSIKDAHNRKNCRHENGIEPWACCHCDCTKRLEEQLQQQGKAFLQTLRKRESGAR